MDRGSYCVPSQKPATTMCSKTETEAQKLEERHLLPLTKLEGELRKSRGAVRSLLNHTGKMTTNAVKSITVSLV